MRKHTKFGKVQPPPHHQKTKKKKTEKHFETARGEQAGRRNPEAAPVAHRGPQRYAKKLSADPL